MCVWNLIEYLGRILSGVWRGIAPLVFGGVFIALGVASFVSGLGLFNVSRWAWWLSFAAFLITTIVMIVYLQVPEKVVNGAGVVLLLLVRKHFGIGRAKLINS